METKLLNVKGQETGKIELPGVIFSVKANAHFLHEMVKYYLAAKRVGTASSKTRTEVSGGGRKPWKQKGTGRARAGSNRSPVWRKGGVVFGPKPRDFSIDMPKAKRVKALVQALSVRNAEGGICVFENFNFETAKTRNITNLLKTLKMENRNALLVTDKNDEKLLLSLRNLGNVTMTLAADLNAYDVLRSHVMFVSKDALETIKKKLEVK
ncbi:MAG: 50S ribosomal protein L4 [Elusimicrobia bacterium CG08_land_8_20_14_0_20_51_18]|nr:MAG: 50S ribosomal protein L4 [Elusimicrobia bacterium CG08_land_8_20_14_0_20_51_18]